MERFVFLVMFHVHLLSANIGSLLRAGFGRAELSYRKKMAYLSVYAFLMHPLPMPSWQQMQTFRNYTIRVRNLIILSWQLLQNVMVLRHAKPSEIAAMFLIPTLRNEQRLTSRHREFQ